MVGFDVSAFEDVWIDCALCEEVDSGELACFFFEYADELASNDFSLFFWLFDACEFI